MDKSDLRQKLLSVRASVCDRAQKDKRITDAAVELAKPFRSVFCYVSMGSEVSTRDILHILSLQRPVFVPHTDKHLHMTARRFLPETRLDCDKRGNVSPVGDPLQTCAQLIFVPLLGYNIDGYRIGYGAGCYDKYFARYPNGYKVGLAYKEQCVDWRPEANDVPLDCIITPEDILIPREKRSTSTK